MDNIDIDKLLENIVPMEDLTELQVGHIVKGVIAGVFNEFSTCYNESWKDPICLSA